MIGRSFDCITIGGATRDIMFYTREGSIVANPNDPLRQTLVGFEYGAKIAARACYFMLGGGACNVAVGVSRLGLRSAAIFSCGTDRDGDAIIRDLADERVDISSVKRHHDKRTGFSFIVITEETGEHVAFLFRGANDALTVSRTDLERRKTRWLYISSLGEGAWNRLTPVLLDVLHERPVKLAWNPGEKQLCLGYSRLRPILARTDVLFLNKDEAIELVLSSGARMSPALKRLPNLLRAVRRFGPVLVVITDGGRGAAVYNGHQVYARPAIRGRIVDTTGAGDSFGAGFVAGLRHFHDLEPALRLALKNSSAKCGKIGSQQGLLRWERIAKEFERHRK